ncbi:hypothetical protein [Pseudorhodoferax sp.]|uniref:hypothetical protein n=1 Tax=Pseudorhodoferax sp. TaxID=1993553 RepID=UPI0039E6E844
MAARWIFGALALVFLVLALARARRLRRLDTAAHTWGWLALVFGAVALWLTVTFGR